MASILSSIQSLVIGTDKKALLLGAGFVTKPTVEILAKNGVEVTVGEHDLNCTLTAQTDNLQPVEHLTLPNSSAKASATPNQSL